MPDGDWVAHAAAEYRSGRPLVLLFDYDGTLTPIVPRPDQAILADATRERLAALAQLERVTVGVLSGRGLGHLKELIGLPGVWYAGSSGMDLDLGGEPLADQAIAEFDRIADALMVALSEPIRCHPGTWVERKPGCLSVHHRALAEPTAVDFRDEVHKALAFLGDAAPPLRIRDVTKALEITLANGWTKGDAVDRMLAGAGRGVFPIFAGDAANDAEAVTRVNALGGLTIGIGPEPPEGTTDREPTTEDFIADLDRLFDALAPRFLRDTFAVGSAPGRLSMRVS